MATTERAFGHPFSAVLFDLDGVLIDTTDAVTALWEDRARAHGVTLSQRDITDCILGCSPEHTVASLFGHLDEPSRRQLLGEVRAAEPHLGFRIVPAARDLARRLHAARVPAALVTGASATRAQRVLESSELAASFATRVVWGDVARGKPAPDAYLLAALRLGLPPHDCLVLEDAPNGVRAGVAAGATVLGVSSDSGSRREALLAAGAHHVVSSFEGFRFRAGAETFEVILPSDLIVSLRRAS